ncbi:hypothetical protein N7475_006500 [Penicillium sp. IBT 31633x]|nr:hypothetical protein N7475_006500 [Penicillium sp. IBT 31633x]
MPDDQADQYPQRGHTALHVLLESPTSGKKTSVACVESLLQAGADIHARSPDGCTALHYAFQHQAADIVRLLLDSGADPTEENDYGATPLHAGWREDPGSLHVLLNAGLVDVNKAIDKSGKPPLLCQLTGLVPEAALALLEEYNPDVNIVDNSGNSPLHAIFARPSCYRQEPWGRVIDLLIARGANPHAKNREGNTPLHVIKDQHSQFISKMLAAGADLEARNHDGQTVLFKHINAATWKEDRIPLFQNLINLGSRIDARDSDGRTLLHQCCINTDRLDFLIGIGLDPLATDHRGNSLLMELVAAHCEDDQRVVIDHLIGLGLAIDQPNHLGRTPLHTLCARMKIFRYLSDSMEHHLSHIMRLCKNISPADRHGVQPLHLAATISEARVFELSDAGADMFGVTHEGMSVLHIAARARQPNIVALVCSELSKLGEPTRLEFLNQQNYEGQTALHFACRSGRLETVKVLLEAGANANILDTKKHSPFRFCAQFEAEQQLWVNNNKLDHREFLDAAGVLLNDNARPFVGPSPCGQTYYEKPHTEHSALRLDEILALLVCHGALSIGKNECFRHAFDHAISNRYEYTVECLTRLQARFSDLVPDIKPSILLRSDYRICKYRLNATKQALKEVGDFDNNRDSGFSLEYNFMEDLILNGHCDLFEERIKKKYDYLFQLISSGKSLLHCLVTWGYRDLLTRVCDRDAASKYDDHDWCLKAEQKFDCRKNPVEPLLVKACARDMPNMNVVELLVEKFSISLNAQRRTAIWDLEFPQVTEGPLHVLAAGHNWWHVDKALPYLIKKGANLEIRDENAMTPLHTALDSSRSRGPFYKIAIKVLMESGADVNAVDSHEKTCLSKVGDDVELVKLLVAHGAHVTAAAVFSAIEGAQIEILRILLSHVDCANIKRFETGFEHVDYFASFKLLYSETPPLLYAAISKLRSLPLDSVSSATKTGIITTLLDHGADPFTTFFLQMSSQSKQHSDRYDSEEIVSVFDGPDSLCSKSEREPQARTVIHEVFKNGGLVAPFFQLPSLQLEIRDSAGCTLLLAASQNLGTLHTKIKSTEAGKTVTKSVFQELIDRGADLMAQDNDGNTILHHITCFDFDSELFETLKEIISKTTGLLHQPDSAGNTFFHRVLALRKFSLIDDLLNMEVDPLQSDSNGDTVLHHLAGCLKQKEIQNYFTRFVDAGLDINFCNNQGSTPLFMYIENSVVPPSSYEHTVDEEEDNHTETVFDFFEERGADFFARNDSGSSLLHLLASKKENNSHGPQIPHNVVRRFKILMSRGLDPMAEDARQRTSLDVAAACGSEHILKLFARGSME